MITDNLDEVFDVVDINDRVIGQSTRGEVHNNKNLIHRSVGIAVFNSNQKIFLQRRSLTKDVDALLWTISCSGHVLSGEGYNETAKRELWEELGIQDTVINFLTKYIYKGLVETEITSLYKVVYNGEIVLQTEEILEGKFLSKEEVIRTLAAKEIELSLYGKSVLEKLGFLK